MNIIPKTMSGMLQGKLDMPILKPIIIPTKGLSWRKKVLAYFKARKWEVVEDYYLYIPWLDRTLVIPKDFVFDMASIPRVFWPLINPTGILLVGSLFHDFGYRYNCLLDDKFNVVYNKKGQKFLDFLLKDIGTYVNGAHIMNSVAWFMLRLFGFFAWRERRAEDAKVRIDFADVVVLD